MTIGGGDENKLRCHNQEDGERTQQLRSLGDRQWQCCSSTYKYLFPATSLQSCPGDIKKACHYDRKEQDGRNCSGLLENAKSELQRCLSIPAHRSCLCWENKVSHT